MSLYGGLLEYGCKHYKRNCKLVAPCCRKIFTCRFCHDEHEKHTLDRKSVSEIVCSMCETKQQVQQYCMNCGMLFGQYFCGDCKLFDMEDKGQFHCEKCGICRVGGRENFFHCKVCDFCLSKTVKNWHKCVEKASKIDCPICLEDVHSSRIAAQVPKCGHLLHTTCFKQLSSQTGKVVCPVCQIPMEILIK